MYKHVARTLHLLLLVILLGTCSSTIYFFSEKPTGVLAENLSSTAVPIRFPATADSAADTGWVSLRPGLERRVNHIYDSQNQLVESVYVWRLDQKYFRMDVAFDDTPRTLESWQHKTGALMVVNGGYYSIRDEEYFPDGLTVVNGVASGQSFGYGGMLAIKDARAELRWLVQRPYSAGEQLQAALQSFPILVEPGGKLGFGAERENHVSARRTAIGQDQEGRILFFIAPQGYFTLHQFSAYLTNSDLNLDIAVNLDGGGSTGLLVSDPQEVIPPTRAIPFVILVYPR